MSSAEDVVVVSGNRLTGFFGGSNHQYFTIFSDRLPDAIVPFFNFVRHS